MSLLERMPAEHKKPAPHDPFNYPDAPWCGGAAGGVFDGHSWEPASAWTVAQARALAFQAFRQRGYRRPRLQEATVRACSACRLVRLVEAPQGRRPVRVLQWPDLARFDE